MITENILNIAIEICMTTLMLQSVSPTGPACPELLALAELESTFNPKAIGAVGEIGLYQMRPEYFGKIPSSIKGQTKKAFELLTKLKTNECKTDRKFAYIACWNVGITKGRKVINAGRPGPYRTNFKKLVSKWKNWYEKEETRHILSSNLYRTYSTKRMVATETLVLQVPGKK